MSLAYSLTVRMNRPIIGLSLLVVAASPVAAQFPRLAPPPPCRTEGPRQAAVFWPASSASDKRPKIAVFSFQSDVDDATKVYLAFSLPDRIRHRLALDRGLRVATEWSVSRALNDSKARQDSAAARLDADFVVTGRLLILGDQQEVEVELLRPGQPQPVWHASFRATTSLRTVEEAVVRGMGRALGLARPAAPKGWPTTDAGHDAVLGGDAHMRSTTRAGADSARVFYERALSLEPHSSVAAARLARASVTLLERGGEIPGFPGSVAFRRVNELVGRALAADSLSEAWTTRAILARVVDPVRFAGALDAHQRAVSLNRNNADDEHEYGITLMRLGDTRGAEARFRRALQLSPGRAMTFAAMALLASQDSRWNAACELTNASIAGWPYDPLPYAIRAEARLRLSDARHAYSDAELVRRLSTGAWPDALRILVMNGANAIEEARRHARDLTARWLAPGTQFEVRDGEYIAMAYLAVGDQRRAIEALKRARPVGADLRAVLRGPRLAAIRRDTAVVRLLAESEGRSRE
jgi:TolB-like protein/tetratricopeptide (TPR) repeat protein